MAMTHGQEPCKFEVPDGDRSLLFGSFDNLIRLTDDLAKADAQVDSVLHRLERQPGAERLLEIFYKCLGDIMFSYVLMRVLNTLLCT